MFYNFLLGMNALEMGNANTYGKARVADIQQERHPKGLEFNNISYSVSVQDDESKKYVQKQILHSVSGKVKSGEMLCILGPSGSGKTSLIQVIAGRIKSTSSKSHFVDGTVTVENKELNSTEFRRLTGLVTQEDIFEGCLTVEETLYFAAALKLKCSSAECMVRVNETIDSLQLNACRNTFIGDDANPYMKGISGGEKRRLAIAMELLDPSICFLIADEPTSGLDAASAQAVANLMRSLADQGMTILTTLHQPRTSIMARFNSVMIMAGGRAIYNGPCEKYIPYVNDVLKCEIPTHENPYDILLDALNPAISALEGLSGIGAIPPNFDGDVGNFLADLLESNNGKSPTVSVQGMHVDESEKSIFHFTIPGLIRWMQVTWFLFLRIGLIKIRDPICLATQVSSGILMGVIYGMLYYDSYNKVHIMMFAHFSVQRPIVCVSKILVLFPSDENFPLY